MRVEKGVMVLKDGKAWGVKLEDERSTEFGWISPEFAPIHDPEFCKKTTDVTYRDSPYIEELEKGELVQVERKTIMSVVRVIK